MTEQTRIIIDKNSFLDMFAIINDMKNKCNAVWGRDYFILQLNEFNQMQIEPFPKLG